MSELHDRLEALSNRGAKRGADDVLRAARRDAESGAVTDATGDDHQNASIADDELPFVSADLDPRRRRRFGSFVAAAGVAALVGVSALAVTAMFGSGGAGSPEGAVRQLADAISNKDPLAAVDVLVPSEVRSLRQTVNDATKRAADLKIVNDASQPLNGVDLSVNNLQLSTQSLGDGFAKVTITGGEFSASTHRAQMSATLQKAFGGGAGDAQGQVDLATIAANADLPTFLIVERQDGRWYVSPAYTALEYVREVNHDPAADFGSANAAQLGSDTPQDAVTDALHAAQAGNWDRLFALAPPDELPLYDYRAMLDKEIGSEARPDFTIDSMSTTASVNGDTATVQLSASGTSGSDHEKWQIGGTCPTEPGQLSAAAPLGTSSGSDSSASGGSAQLLPERAIGATGSGGTAAGVLGVGPSGAETGGGSFSANSSLCISGDLRGLLPLSLAGVADGTTDSGGAVSISVVQEDGRWFLSPVTTVLASVDSAIEHIDQRTLYSALGLAYELPPDGTITLDQPFRPAVSGSIFSAAVYTFAGQAGEEVVGEAASARAPDGFAFGSIYTADGTFVGQAEFGSVSGPGSGIADLESATQLPSTGNYRLVVESVSASTTLTLWNLPDAPEKLRNAVAAAEAQDGSSETCTSTPGLGGGSESCQSSGVITHTTAPSIGGSSSSSATTTTSP